MTRYIALLRGVNISGKNKVPMPELKQYCTELGYDGVVTYLNSGNIVFSQEDRDEQELAEEIKNLITENFGLDVPAFVIKQTALREILDSAPEWWGTDDKDIYDNLIFVMPPADAYWVSGRIGTPTEGLEQIEICQLSLIALSEKDAYIEGFKIGVKMTTEIYADTQQRR